MLGFNFDLNNPSKKGFFDMIICIIIFILGFSAGYFPIQNTWNDFVGTLLGLIFVAIYLRICIYFDDRKELERKIQHVKILAKVHNLSEETHRDIVKIIFNK